MDLKRFNFIFEEFYSKQTKLPKDIAHMTLGSVVSHLGLLCFGWPTIMIHVSINIHHFLIYCVLQV